MCTILQTDDIPLSDFAAANPLFDPGQLNQIRFRFDRTRTAVILLDDVGPAHGPAPMSDEYSRK